MEPLLELVKDDQQFLAAWDALASAKGSNRLDQPTITRLVRTRLSQPFQEPGLGFVSRRLGVDGDHVLGQPGQQARLDERRLAAPRRPVDEPDAERVVSVPLLDPVLPEADRVG